MRPARAARTLPTSATRSGPANTRWRACPPPMMRTARPKRWLCACATPSPGWNWNCCTPCMPTPTSSPAPRGWSMPGRGCCGWAKRPRPVWTCPTAGGTLCISTAATPWSARPSACRCPTPSRRYPQPGGRPATTTTPSSSCATTTPPRRPATAAASCWRTPAVSALTSSRRRPAWCASSPASRTKAFAGCWSRGRPLPRPRSSWRTPARAWARCRGCTTGFCGGMSAAAPGATPGGRC